VYEKKEELVQTQDDCEMNFSLLKKFHSYFSLFCFATTECFFFSIVNDYMKRKRRRKFLHHYTILWVCSERKMSLLWLEKVFACLQVAVAYSPR
jgi:hypothetical protein